jgi:hypothetical protein
MLSLGLVQSNMAEALGVQGGELASKPRLPHDVRAGLNYGGMNKKTHLI